MHLLDPKHRHLTRPDIPGPNRTDVALHPPHVRHGSSERAWTWRRSFLHRRDPGELRHQVREAWIREPFVVLLFRLLHRRNEAGLAVELREGPVSDG